VHVPLDVLPTGKAPAPPSVWQAQGPPHLLLSLILMETTMLSTSRRIFSARCSHRIERTSLYPLDAPTLHLVPRVVHISPCSSLLGLRKKRSAPFFKNNLLHTVQHKSVTRHTSQVVTHRKNGVPSQAGSRDQFGTSCSRWGRGDANTKGEFLPCTFERKMEP
jgi:hypothetical protein